MTLPTSSGAPGSRREKAAKAVTIDEQERRIMCVSASVSPATASDTQTRWPRRISVGAPFLFSQVAHVHDCTFSFFWLSCVWSISDVVTEVSPCRCVRRSFFKCMWHDDESRVKLSRVERDDRVCLWHHIAHLYTVLDTNTPPSQALTRNQKCPYTTLVLLRSRPVCVSCVL